MPKYAAVGFCPPMPPAACACGPVSPQKRPTSSTPGINLILSASAVTSQTPFLPDPSSPCATSDGRRSLGKGASTRKKSWSVFKGWVCSPSLIGALRSLGRGLPSFWSSDITRRTARGATSIGIEGQFVRSRRWSFRESIEGGS